ncbi:MAG: barstar family protein, partial [Terriglobia bacterium]
MKNLHLDATGWKTRGDFYNALFEVLGSPSWHGRNFNALRDSMISGCINKVELPYTISISGINSAAPEVQRLVKDFCSLIKEFRAEGCDVDISCVG